MADYSAPSPPETTSESDGPHLDHVGVLVRDLEVASAQWQRRLNASIAHTFDAPSFAIRARFLATASAKIELFTIDDPAALNAELGDAQAKIDHIALRFAAGTDAIDLTGCTIRGPGRPDPIESPIRIADSHHAWVEPPGIDVLIQLITPAVHQL
jgi:hypothetical protein